MPSLLTEYTQLKTDMTGHWGLGNEALKKYNIEPYLQLLADFGERLGELGKSAAQYNELNIKIQEARTRGVPVPAQIQQDRDKFANEVLTKAPVALQKLGQPLKKQRPQFQKNMLGIIGALRTLETKTPEQRTAVLNMLNLLKSANAQAEMESNKDFDTVTGMIEAVQKKNQINILGRKS